MSDHLTILSARMHIGTGVDKVLAIATHLGHSGSVSETAPAFRTRGQEESKFQSVLSESAHVNEEHSPP